MAYKQHALTPQAFEGQPRKCSPATRLPSKAAKSILPDMAAYSAEYYGGNTVEGVGRGDPSTELGDFDTIQTRRNKTAQGYRSSQSYKFVDGVLRDCQVVLTQKNNVTMIEV